jgi:hypothetical protein
MRDDEDADDFEGCYRVPPGDWKVFYFTRAWEHSPGVFPNATFSSGIKGVGVNYPKDKELTRMVVRNTLSELLGVTEWEVVAGPDSLRLK